MFRVDLNPALPVFTLGRPWMDNIRMDLVEMGWGDVD
jgi:hypothetical protein